MNKLLVRKHYNTSPQFNRRFSTLQVNESLYFTIAHYNLLKTSSSFILPIKSVKKEEKPKPKIRIKKRFRRRMRLRLRRKQKKWKARRKGKIITRKMLIKSKRWKNIKIRLRKNTYKGFIKEFFSFQNLINKKNAYKPFFSIQNNYKVLKFLSHHKNYKKQSNSENLYEDFINVLLGKLDVCLTKEKKFVENLIL